MISKKSISIFVTTFLIIGFFFLALPEKGVSQDPNDLGCCIDKTIDPDICIGWEYRLEHGQAVAPVAL